MYPTINQIKVIGKAMDIDVQWNKECDEFRITLPADSGYSTHKLEDMAAYINGKDQDGRIEAIHAIINMAEWRNIDAAIMKVNEEYMAPR